MSEKEKAEEVSTAEKKEPKRKVWIYLNRNKFPVYLPHPEDSGSSVCFPPVAKDQVMGMLDFKTDHRYAAYTGLKSSITCEPAPDYLALTDEDIKASEQTSVPDFMKMNPDELVKFVQAAASVNPEIAQQLSNALGVVGKQRKITQAPPGA